MKARRLALLALAVLGLGCAAGTPRFGDGAAPAQAERPIVDAARLHRETLENGVHVIVLEDHRLPRVVLGVTVRRGESSVEPERAGLAAYTAEVMQRGAGDRDALALARAIEELGAGFDVSADWDSTNAMMVGLSEDLPRLLPLLADVVLRPRFDPAEARKAKAETLSALEAQKDDPKALAGKNLQRTIYGGHRFGTPLAGSTQTVSKLDVADVRAFHRGAFVASDAIVYASGDVDAADFVARVREAFGAWPAGEPIAVGPQPPAPAPPARRVVIVDRPDLVQSQILLGEDGIARSDPGRYAAMLWNDVVAGGGFSSRLMDRVRADAGLTYSIGGGFAMRRAPGPYVVSTFTRVPETRRVIDLVLAELERGRTEPPTEAELGDAKRQAVGTFVLGLETSDAIAAALVGLDVQGLPPDSLDAYRGRIRAVTAAEVEAAGRERVRPERMAIVVVGPAAALRGQLEGLGPIEVVSP